MTTQQVPSRPHIEMTVTDAKTLHLALDFAMQNASNAVNEFTEAGNARGAVAAANALAEVRALHDRLFRTFHDAAAAANKELPFAELPSNASGLTLMVSTLIALKSSIGEALRNPEQTKGRSAEELAELQNIVANAQSLAQRIAAFLREVDPRYTAAFAKAHATADKANDLPGWEEAPDFNKASFEEFAQLIGGGPAAGSTRLQ